MFKQVWVVMLMTVPPPPAPLAPTGRVAGMLASQMPYSVLCIFFAVNAPCARTKLSYLYAGLPPAYIVLAECDIVHDEGEMYAQKLLDAGNTVHMKDYKGACHGHMMMAVDASIGGLKCQNGLDAIDDLCKMLAHLFKAA